MINNVIEGAKTSEKTPKMSESDCSIECNRGLSSGNERNTLPENTPSPIKEKRLGFWWGLATGVVGTLLFFPPKPEEKNQRPDADSGLQPPVQVQPAEGQKPKILQPPAANVTAQAGPASLEAAGNNELTLPHIAREEILPALDKRPLEHSEMPEEQELGETLEGTPAASESGQIGRVSPSDGSLKSRGRLLHGILLKRSPFKPSGYFVR